MIPIAKPYFDEKELRALEKVLASGWVAQGPKVKEFEDDFASLVGARCACAVTSCTTGLHLALSAVGVKPGDFVVTVSHSFIATSNSIRHCGAEPIFADIDLDTYNMSPSALEKCLKENKRISAILAVHQMGMPCNLEKINALARKYGVPLIEDAACAIGSRIKYGGMKNWEYIGKPHSEIAVFSFHPRKLITTGEGGMLTTNNRKYDSLFRLLRHHGMSISDTVRHKARKVIFEEYPVTGYNYRMSDIQASVGIEQLKKLPVILRKRRDIADIYIDKLRSIDWLKTPYEPDYCRTNWQSFPVMIVENSPLSRNKIMQKLLDKGIATRPGVMNAHSEPCYNKVHSGSGLKNSETARDSVMLLPIFHSMMKEDLDYVIKYLKGI